MDAKQYKAFKEAGGVQIIRQTKDNAAVYYTSFNPANGEKLDPIREDYDLVGLRNQRDALQAQLDGLNMIISDLESAEVLVK